MYIYQQYQQSVHICTYTLVIIRLLGPRSNFSNVLIELLQLITFKKDPLHALALRSLQSAIKLGTSGSQVALLSGFQDTTTSKSLEKS